MKIIRVEWKGGGVTRREGGCLESKRGVRV